MKRNRSKLVIVRYRMIYTSFIIIVYLVGRKIPLYGVDLSAYMARAFTAEDFLLQTVGGDINRYSLLALGISPYVAVSVGVQAYAAFKGKGSRGRISLRKMNKVTIAGTMLLAFIQAVLHSRELTYSVPVSELLTAQFMATLQMTAGAAVVILLSEYNQKYGIGGRTVLIYVNIVDGLIYMVEGSALDALKLPVAAALILTVATVLMENSEFRIPLQRISIHSIYAEKNYLAIKLNPIGMMPVMFASAFFMVPVTAVQLAESLVPNSGTVQWWAENMTLTEPLGMCVYIIVIYVLTAVFSVIYISPGNLAEQLLKNGDSLMGIHAGNDTRKYLSRTLKRLSIFSATVMSVCLGIPFALQNTGWIDGVLVMLPSLAMIMTGIWFSLYREYEAVRDFDSYEMFF